MEFLLKVSELKRMVLKIAEFPRKNWCIVSVIACCDLAYFARASVPLPDPWR